MSCKSLLILLIVPFVLLSCFVERGVSIKCFTCRSDTDPKCADPFENSTIPIIDCDHPERKSEHSLTIKPSMCRKIRQKDDNGKWQYFRSCTYNDESGTEGEEKCIVKTDTNNVSVESCTCNSKHGCNSAPGLHYNTFFITFFIITWFLRP